MGKKLDITGQRIGSLEAIKPVDKVNKHRHSIWIFRCDCGSTIERSIADFRAGDIKSCGCTRNIKIAESRLKDITGQKFGRLLVIAKVNRVSSTDRSMLWLCKCDCGKTKNIRGSTLRNGRSQSCGCLISEASKSRGGKNHHWYKHGRGDDWEYYERSSRSYRKFIREVKERDKHSCYVCKKYSKNNKGLVAHHLDCYNNFPEKRTDIDNGITLCNECHIKFHAKYSQESTAEQFYEWLRLLEVCQS